MTDTPVLLPCPFCGGAPKVRQAVGETWVVCGSCAASTNSITRASVAFDLWNRRAAAPSVQPDRGVIDRISAAIADADFGGRYDGRHDDGSICEVQTDDLRALLAALTVQKEEG